MAGYPFREMQHQVLFFVLFALLANKQCKSGKGYTLKKNKNIIQSIVRIIYIVIILFFSIVIFLYVYRFRSTYILDEARNEFPFDEKKGLHLYQLAHTELQGNPEFLLEYGVRAVETDSVQTARNLLEKSKQSFVNQIHLIELGYCYERLHNYELAEKYYIQAIHVSPSKLAPRYQLLLFYDRTGRKEKAKEIGEKILGIKPKIKSDERVELIKEMVKKYLKKIGNE
ncbi:MAG: hypothetical protein IT249_07380 [Chitinophagaceae bacterium]|nr:hypothetical protein [Chitinophagaceae bacterium]